ncbi:YciI family protein [Parvularcula sp. IMCC14364]|uniref:YciI family protein n=1 Tax=Parvularcula sp. IMCC14364 TaxID=3067902 RepID=UPI0027424975|nr:YciI family protein [Parvularcula sp. IMCC14364]
MKISFQIMAGIASLALLAGSHSMATEPEDSPYNADLAEKLGADEYGMRSYVFVTLLTGPAEITDADERNALFRGHFSNMAKLAEDGKLVLAGPFIEGEPKRGLFIFDVKTVEEAQSLVETDPAVAAGIFKAEYTKYYGSAALKMINDIHGTIQKTKIE